MFSEQSQPSKAYTTQAAFWKWEKRHWILIIALLLLAFWYFAPSLNSSPWLQSSLNFLPLIGGLAFATETILKLAQ